MTIRSLKISKSLTLPIDAVTQKLGWIGTTGSGKTYGASKLAELFWELHAQFVALDPVGVWYGLRLDKSGKKPSDITIPIFGGLHGDVPLEPTSGALMADLIVDRGISAVLDVSQFEHDSDKARFAAAFANRFFFRKKAAPSAVHLFLEECQEFVPQNPQRGEEQMLHAFVRMQKIGRNFGIGTSLITQRPQEVNKKALNLAQTLFVFRTTGSHERTAIEHWIKDKAIAGQDIGSELPKLKTGAPHVWSPEWLDLSEVVHVTEKRTFNASVTPEVGAVATRRELATIDLEKIKTDIAATIEKAKADDPKLLKVENARLRGELEKAQRAKPVAVAPGKTIEKPVLTAADRALLTKLAPMLEQMAGHLGVRKEMAFGVLDERIRAAVLKCGADITKADDAARTAFTALCESKGIAKILGKLAVVQTSASYALEKDKQVGRQVASAPHAVAAPRAAAPRPAPTGPVGDDARLYSVRGLHKHAVAMLTALAQHPDGRDREQVHILASYSPNGKTGSAIAGMLDRRWIVNEGSQLKITNAGLEALGPYDPLPTGRALGEYLVASPRLAITERKMLPVLLGHNRIPLTRQEWVDAAGYKPNGKTGSAIAKFLRLGWAVQLPTGIVASDIFYEE